MHVILKWGANMFSIFTQPATPQKQMVAEQLLYIVEQALLYEAKHISGAFDKMRLFGMLYYEVCEQCRYHKEQAQQKQLQNFHKQAFEQTLLKQHRIEHLWDCYKLLKSQQTGNLEHQLRFQLEDILAIYEHFQMRKQFNYDLQLEQQFFAAIYADLMPIIATINDVYR